MACNSSGGLQPSASTQHKQARFGHSLCTKPRNPCATTTTAGGRNLVARNASETLVHNDKYKQFKGEYYAYNDMAPESFDYVLFEKTQCDYTYDAIELALSCHKRAQQRLDEFWETEKSKKSDRQRREAESKQALKNSSANRAADAVAALDANETPQTQRIFEKISANLPAPSAYVEDPLKKDKLDSDWLQTRQFFPQQKSSFDADDEELLKVPIFQAKHATENETLMANNEPDIVYKLPLRPRAFYRTELMDNMDLGILPMDFIAPELANDEGVSPQMHIEHDPKWIPEDVRRILCGDSSEFVKNSKEEECDEDIREIVKREKRKKHTPHVIKMTKIAPFQATLRGEEWERQKQHKLDAMRHRVMQEENKFLYAGRFHANPVPAHVKLNLFEQRRTLHKQRREQVRRDRKRLLKRAERPFSFYEREKMKCRRKLADRVRQLQAAADKQKQLARTFRAAAIPERLLTGDVYVQLQNQLKVREYQREKRQKRLMAEAAWPPSMAENHQANEDAREESTKNAAADQYKQCTFTPHVNTKVPNFRRLRRRFNRQMSRAKLVRPVTRLQPFKMCTTKVEVQPAEEINLLAICPELTGKPKINEYDAKKIEAQLPPLVGTTNTAEMRLTKLRNKRWIQECHERERVREKAERRARDQRVKNRLQPLIQAHDEYSNAMRREATIRMQQQRETKAQMSAQYRKYIKELYAQLDDRPLLIERLHDEQQQRKNEAHQNQLRCLIKEAEQQLAKNEEESECFVMLQNVQTTTTNGNEQPDILEQRIIGMLSAKERLKNNDLTVVEKYYEDLHTSPFDVSQRSVRTQTAAKQLMRKVTQLRQPDEAVLGPATNLYENAAIHRRRRHHETVPIHTGTSRIVYDDGQTEIIDRTNRLAGRSASPLTYADELLHTPGARRGRNIERELKKRYLTPMQPIQPTITHELVVKMHKTKRRSKGEKPAKDPAIAGQAGQVARLTATPASAEPPQAETMKPTGRQNEPKQDEREAEKQQSSSRNRIKHNEAKANRPVTKTKRSIANAKIKGRTKPLAFADDKEPTVPVDGARDSSQKPSKFDNVRNQPQSAQQQPETISAKKETTESLRQRNERTKRTVNNRSQRLEDKESKKQKTNKISKPEPTSGSSKQRLSKTAERIKNKQQLRESPDANLKFHSVVQLDAATVPKVTAAKKTTGRLSTDEKQGGVQQQAKKQVVGSKQRAEKPQTNAVEYSAPNKIPKTPKKTAPSPSTTENIVVTADVSTRSPAAEAPAARRVPDPIRRSRWDDYLPVEAVLTSCNSVMRRPTQPETSAGASTSTTQFYSEHQLDSELDRLLVELDSAEREHHLKRESEFLFQQVPEEIIDDNDIDDILLTDNIKRSAEQQYNKTHNKNDLPIPGENDQFEEELDRILGPSFDAIISATDASTRGTAGTVAAAAVISEHRYFAASEVEIQEQLGESSHSMIADTQLAEYDGSRASYQFDVSTGNLKDVTASPRASSSLYVPPEEIGDDDDDDVITVRNLSSRTSLPLLSLSSATRSQRPSLNVVSEDLRVTSYETADDGTTNSFEQLQHTTTTVRTPAEQGISISRSPSSTLNIEVETRSSGESVRSQRSDF